MKDPNAVTMKQGSRVVAEGLTKEGIKIRTIINPYTKEIISSYPRKLGT